MRRLSLSERYVLVYYLSPSQFLYLLRLGAGKLLLCYPYQNMKDPAQLRWSMLQSGDVQFRVKIGQMRLSGGNCTGLLLEQVISQALSSSACLYAALHAQAHGPTQH